MEHETHRGKRGVWMIYGHDGAPYVSTVWPLLRQAVDNNRGPTGMQLGFWPFGMELRDAIKWYEGDD